MSNDCLSPNSDQVPISGKGERCDVAELGVAVREGKRRAVAQAISMVENGAPRKDELLAQLFPHTGRARRVGFTGAPGAGKSSLIDRYTGYLRGLGQTVGVIAVDPSSPFTGGALLGDRVRMGVHTLDEGVFIRSLATRGSLGGLSRATKQVMTVLDAAGKDTLLVETVGTGQSEVDIVNTADSIVVVLTPASGDTMQIMKAGIVEIADVFVINKIDLPGTDLLVKSIGGMLDMAPKGQWRPPVVMANAILGQGIEELHEALGRHREYLQAEGRGHEARREQLEEEFVEAMVEELTVRLRQKVNEERGLRELVERVKTREVDPYVAALRAVVELLGE